jgi:hypothetical protein
MALSDPNLSAFQRPSGATDRHHSQRQRQMRKDWREEITPMHWTICSWTAYTWSVSEYCNRAKSVITHLSSRANPTRVYEEEGRREERARTYATDSPSFRPTICSVIRTSWYILPLCTAKRMPTKLGSMVAPRFYMRIRGVFGGRGWVRRRGS